MLGPKGLQSQELKGRTIGSTIQTSIRSVWIHRHLQRLSHKTPCYATPLPLWIEMAALASMGPGFVKESTNSDLLTRIQRGFLGHAADHSEPNLESLHASQ